MIDWILDIIFSMEETFWGIVSCCDFSAGSVWTTPFRVLARMTRMVTGS